MNANHPEKFRESVEKKEARRVRSRSGKGMGLSAWFGMLGIVGWSVAVPLLLGIFLGRWLDSIIHRQYSFTLMLMFAGLVLGCANAWFWVKSVGLPGAHKRKPGSEEGTEEKK